MNRNQVTYLTLIMSMLVTHAALAAEAGGQAGADANAVAQSGKTEANTHARVEAQAQARISKEDLDRTRHEIEQRAEKVSAKAKARAEAALNTAAQRVEAEAAKVEKVVADRLAAEFDASAQAMFEQRAALGANWGDLMIAHTLESNTTSAVGVEQLIEYRKGGMGWGTIAAGLGFDLTSVVASVKAEQRVAQGLAKADGKVAGIRGANAQAGIGATAGLGAHAGVGNTASVDAGLGASAGVKIGR